MPSRFPLLLLLLAALPAAATTLLRMDVPALTRTSDTVVRGTVQRKASRWTQDRMRIVTEVEIAVSETLKGEGSAGTVRVLQPGGEVGDLGQRVDGIAAFREGEEVVVFLERKGTGTFRVVGMAQGKFRVERAADGRSARAVPESVGEALLVDPVTRQQVAENRQPLPLEQLRQQVRESAGPAPQQAPGGRTP